MWRLLSSRKCIEVSMWIHTRRLRLMERALRNPRPCPPLKQPVTLELAPHGWNPDPSSDAGIGVGAQHGSRRRCGSSGTTLMTRHLFGLQRCRCQGVVAEMCVSLAAERDHQPRQGQLQEIWSCSWI